MVLQDAPAPTNGLTEHEAAARLAHYGPNELVPKARAGSLFTWVIRLVADPMVILLAVAGVTYFLLGDRFDAIVVAVALVPIFFVTSWLEFRSDRALEKLNDLSPPRALVRRDHGDVIIPARMVVPGDVLLLREGDVIAADGRLLEATRLLVDESSLTGESLPVEKLPRETHAMLAGTIVRSGRGVVLVERTGASTEYGRIARTLGEIKPQRTPIERSIHRIVFQVGFGVILACAFVVGIERAHGDPWGAAVIAGISLAMAAIPEELPMVYTLYLALGAWRLAKDNALVRHLANVETLGATTVICLDKTGTLTMGALAVESSYAAQGFSENDVLEIAAAASDPDSGDPLDRAILEALQPHSFPWTRETHIPFDPDRRYAGAILNTRNGPVLAIKGAYEALSARFATHESDNALRFLEAAAARGGRVLAIAKADLNAPTIAAASTAPLQFVGLISLADAIRDTAREAVARCRSAGVRVIMMTGDHPATAQAVAASVGIQPVDVYARVRPEQKLQIVRDLHARGEVVAMTGDGTNDALALREADIGVAMGKGGTEVARAAGDLVLLDDDITTIVRAIADGRRIFDNLIHAFSYLNAFHAPLLLGAFVLPLLGTPIFLLPIHLIWLELIVHPTSALVFENDAAHGDIMSRGPRDSSRALLSRADWIRTFLLGGTLAAIVIALYAGLLHQGFAEDVARTVAIVAMLSGQIMLVFVERAGEEPIWHVSVRNNPAILPIVAFTIGTVVLAVLLPPVANALHLAPIPPAFAASAILAGCASVLWTQPLIALKKGMVSHA